ncbi:MAG: hypothetical protein B6226_05800 [Candidatus Cloacimonetes bacterium 4572_65]|nr:MAG: hypothetical protein B6226_05800 [Candidatus Cloacimonetes bacterium 4572_65]
MGTISKKIYVIVLIALLGTSLYSSEYSYSVLKSLIVPGWGQISTGHKIGYAQLASEVVAISSIIYFDNEGDVKKEQSVNYAIKYAHIGNDNYTDDYYKTIGRYNSSYYEANGYNQEVLNQAINLYPGDPDSQQTYINANAMAENKSWRWDSKKNRYKYNNLRTDYHSYADYVKTTTGLLIANHFTSFIHMMIKYKGYNKNDRVTFSSTMTRDYTPMVNVGINF